MAIIRSYEEALRFMYEHLPMYQRIGQAAYKKDLTNTLLLSAQAGDPHDKLKCIHIAGTNGKGTSTHLIAAGLQAQGYKVGVYTSPHYKDFRERIKINGRYISRQFIIKFLNEYRSDIEEIRPSFFEMTVVLAFSYFAAKKTDYAVIETGLGGRLDSTNIITPLLSVITNISYDHQNLLGDTLEQIATEKAGIIKTTVPVVIGERQSGLDKLFTEGADQLSSPISFASEHLSAVAKTSGVISNFTLLKDGREWLKFTTDLTGPFQEKNLITAFYALDKLSTVIKIDFSKICEFMPHFREATKYLGRWQIISQHPLTIADSAHNEGGLTIVLHTLNKLAPGKIHFVLGFVNDKDLSKVLSLFPESAVYYYAKANIPRGLDAGILRDTASKFGLRGKAYKSVRLAFSAARRCAAPEDLIFIGGSIFVVAEII